MTALSPSSGASVSVIVVSALLSTTFPPRQLSWPDFDPAIHVFAAKWIGAPNAWITGSSPVMTTLDRDSTPRRILRRTSRVHRRRCLGGDTGAPFLDRLEAGLGAADG